MHVLRLGGIALPFLSGAVAIPVVAMIVALFFGRRVEFVVGQVRGSHVESVALVALALTVLSMVSLGLYVACLRLGPENPRFRTSLVVGCLSTFGAVAIFWLTLSELFSVLLHFGVAAAAGLIVRTRTGE